jgi:hypothetical protein
MTSTKQTQPKWGAKHDAIIAQYEHDVKEGIIREVVIIPRD